MCLFVLLATYQASSNSLLIDISRKSNTSTHNIFQFMINLLISRLNRSNQTRILKLVYRHWLPTNLMSLSHFSLFVFVKQLKKNFKTKTGLSIQVFLKVSKKGEGRCHCLYNSVWKLLINKFIKFRAFIIAIQEFLLATLHL